MGDTLATMQVCEMCMFVVDAVAGPQNMTTRLWHEAEVMRTSRCVFINHIDREGANFDVAMAQLHARFGSRLGAVTIPIGVDKDFKGVIDILRMKASLMAVRRLKTFLMNMLMLLRLREINCAIWLLKLTMN